jgi:hypothetical protein
LWTLSHSEEVAVGFAMLLSTESAGERSWTAFFTTVVLVTVLLLPGPVSGAVTCEWVYVTKAKPTEMQKANWRAQRLSLLGRTDLLVISEGTLNKRFLFTFSDGFPVWTSAALEECQNSSSKYSPFSASGGDFLERQLVSKENS